MAFRVFQRDQRIFGIADYQDDPPFQGQCSAADEGKRGDREHADAPQASSPLVPLASDSLILLLLL